MIKLFQAKEKYDITLPMELKYLMAESKELNEKYMEKVMATAKKKAETFASRAIAKVQNVKAGKRPRKN